MLYGKDFFMETLKGKKVLIAGASGGIGSALARLMAGSGAEIFLTGRSAEKLEEIRLSLGLDSSRVLAADLTEPADVERLKAAFTAVFSQPDIVINTAGVGIIKPMEQLSPEEFITSFMVNLFAPFLLMKAFLPLMKEQKKGLVIHIPGVLGKTPMQGAAAYSASKYGLTGMMQSIREEIKRTEIRVTNLYLGGTDTAFWDTIDLRVQRDKMIRAEEAARAIWFLCQQPAGAVVSEMALQPFNHQAI